MPSHPRLLPLSIAAIQLARIVNALLGIGFIVVFAATIIAEAQLSARLIAKYGPDFDVALALTVLRCVLAFGVPAVWSVERLLRSLRVVLISVADGDPFATANVERFRTVSWMLLVLQLIDLALGGTTWLAGPLGIETIDWQPNITGWFAVLVAFVLIRVFAAGTALRDDLVGTV